MNFDSISACPSLLVRLEWAPSDLLVYVYRCRHLVFQGKSNDTEDQVQPFVRISIGSNTSRTKVSNNPVDPQYEEQFVFNLNPLIRSCEPGVMDATVLGLEPCHDLSVTSPALINIAVIDR